MKCYYEMEVGEVLTIEMKDRGFCRIKAVRDEIQGGRCERCIIRHTDYCARFLCQDEMRVAYGDYIHFEAIEWIGKQ